MTHGHHTQEDPQAWQEGFEAGQRGQQWSDCPYHSGTTESLSWMAGLIEANARNVTQGHTKANRIAARVGALVDTVERGHGH